MAAFDRGTKRLCLNCGTKFYDLTRDPIICPSCGETFVPEAVRAAAAKAKAKAKEAEQDKDTDDDDVEDGTEVAEADTAATAAGAEVISLDDAEDDDDDTDELIPDVEDVEVDDTLGGDKQDVFLEEEDDDDNIGIDVSTGDDED